MPCGPFFCLWRQRRVTGLLLLLPRSGKRNYYAREGFVAGWPWPGLSSPCLGLCPFTSAGEIPSYLDCVFETISGFTTTGASILTDVEALPKGLLYWRSFTHWLGGMGVLVFVLALQPRAKGEGQDMHLIAGGEPRPRSVQGWCPKCKNPPNSSTGSILNDPAANPVAGFGGNAPV